MRPIENLNPQQIDAVKHTEGPLLILAGAGSGKTGTMTHRIAYLIQDKGVSPWNILAVTFTNKAAGEMRDRVEALTGSIAGLWIMTFHALCLRMLRAHSDRTDHKSGFVVYDPTDQKVVVKSCVKDLDLDDKKFAPNYVLSVISDAKGKGKRAADFEADGADTRLRRHLADIYTAYEESLKRNNAMDFDDLILNAVDLLDKNPDVLDEYRNRFRYVMVDEYQDTDPLQYKLISLLAIKHRNLCVVGDDDQCIYQWRGADINNILDFERDFKGTKVIKLEQNYRSNGNILNGANSIIAHNAGRKSKKLWTDRGDGELIQFEQTDDEKAEARFVAKTITEQLDEGYDWKDFAVLYRTNAQSRTFEESLSAMQIPYRVLGGLRYYDRKEIKDMLCYMRLVSNPDDDVSLTRIISEPRRGVGEKTYEKIAAFAYARGSSIFAMLTDEDVLDSLTQRARGALAGFVGAINKYASGSYKVSEIYDGLLKDSGYLGALEAQNSVEAEGRIENLLEFRSVILDYETEDAQLSLSDFLERISLLADIDNHDNSENAVTLMTLHSAKGLEFPVVFMPGMEDGLFPSARSSENPGGVEEERRLCYVGMTRAMDRLYMIRAKSRTMYGRWDRTLESRFLREIDTSCLSGAEKLGQETTGYFHEAIGAEDGFAEAEIYRPFDQLKRAKAELVNEFKVGDRVRHSKFGEGAVIEVYAGTVTVIFGSVGKKKLAVDVAPLELI